tara:strand:+ start:4825 stop:5946 length:1122 start_codon:yes stop_codon:yes gene_type:complete
MKVLILFLDSIRPNRLGTFNKKIKKNSFDYLIDSLGGDLYINAFTPGPDTPRSNSAFLTGIHPNKNGCDIRLKWPNFYLKDIENIFDFFDSKNYKIDCFSPVSEIRNGFYPKTKTPINFTENENYLQFLKKLKLVENHLIFLSFPDLHKAIDDFGANKIAEKKGYELLTEILSNVFKVHDKDLFDHILIYSDHGYKFSREYKFQKSEFLLNYDRTNIFLLKRSKKQKKIFLKDQLISIEDIFPLFKKIILKQNLSINRKYVLIEDHLNFNVSHDQEIEQWALAFKDYIYVRSKNRAVKFYNRGNKKVYGKDEILDNTLRLESKSFRKFYDKDLSLKRYNKNFRDNNFKYSNNKPRKNNPKLLKRIYDLISEFL